MCALRKHQIPKVSLLLRQKQLKQKGNEGCGVVLAVRCCVNGFQWNMVRGGLCDYGFVVTMVINFCSFASTPHQLIFFFILYQAFFVQFLRGFLCYFCCLVISFSSTHALTQTPQRQYFRFLRGLCLFWSFGIIHCSHFFSG